VSISSSGQYAIACVKNGSGVGYIHYSRDKGITWSQSNSAQGLWTSVSISGREQYAVGCISGGQIYQCLATN
jgi:hypothetical protein